MVSWVFLKKAMVTFCKYIIGPFFKHPNWVIIELETSWSYHRVFQYFPHTKSIGDPSTRSSTFRYWLWGICYILLFPSPRVLKNCALGTSNITITWELLKEANSWDPPRHTESETLGVAGHNLSLKEISGWFWYISLRWNATANHMAKQMQAKPVGADFGRILKAHPVTVSLRSQKTEC